MHSPLTLGHTRRRLAAAAIAALIGAPALAACGTSNPPAARVAGSESASQQVQAAFSSLLKGNTLTTTVRAGLTAAQLEKVSHNGLFGHSGIDSRLAQEIAGGELAFEEHVTSGSLGTTRDFKAVQAEVRFVEQGKPLVDLRYVNSTIYAQAQVKQLLSLFNQPTDVFGNLQAEVSHLPSFVQALLNGKYVSVPTSALSGLATSVGSVPSATPNPAQAQELLQGFKSLFAKDVKVVRLSSSSDGGTYLLSGNTRTLAAALIKQVATVLPMAGSLSSQSSGRIPNKTIKLGLTINEGKISQITMNLAQFAATSDGLSANTQLPIDLDFSTAPAVIAAPIGAVAVNVQQLTGLLSLVLGTHSQSGTSPLGLGSSGI